MINIQLSSCSIIHSNFTALILNKLDNHNRVIMNIYYLILGAYTSHHSSYVRCFYIQYFGTIYCYSFNCTDIHVIKQLYAISLPICVHLIFDMLCHYAISFNYVPVY